MLIVIDGVDGTGKSTLCRGLADAIEGAIVLRPCETDNSFARLARGIEKSSPEFCAKLPCDIQRAVAENYIFQFSAFILREIEPRLALGQTVICDRYWYSLVANQAFFGVECRGFVPAFKALPSPDLAVLLECPPWLAHNRAKVRDKVPPWYSEDFLLRTARILREHSREWGLRSLDSERSPADMLEVTLDLVSGNGQ